MIRLRSLNFRWRAGARYAALAAIACAASLGCVLGADPQPATDAKAAKSEAKPATKAKPQKKKLDGAELYAMHCNRCHPERYPTERTAAQWKTIVTHMRVRANLPASQAKTILKYLEEESGK